MSTPRITINFQQPGTPTRLSTLVLWVDRERDNFIQRWLPRRAFELDRLEVQTTLPDGLSLRPNRPLIGFERAPSIFTSRLEGVRIEVEPKEMEIFCDPRAVRDWLSPETAVSVPYRVEAFSKEERRLVHEGEVEVFVDRTQEKVSWRLKSEHSVVHNAAAGAVQIAEVQLTNTLPPDPISLLVAYRPPERFLESPPPAGSFILAPPSSPEVEFAFERDNEVKISGLKPEQSVVLPVQADFSKLPNPDVLERVPVRVEVLTEDGLKIKPSPDSEDPTKVFVRIQSDPRQVAPSIRLLAKPSDPDQPDDFLPFYSTRDRASRFEVGVDPVSIMLPPPEEWGDMVYELLAVRLGNQAVNGEGWVQFTEIEPTVELEGDSGIVLRAGWTVSDLVSVEALSSTDSLEAFLGRKLLCDPTHPEETFSLMLQVGAVADVSELEATLGVILQLGGKRVETLASAPLPFFCQVRVTVDIR